MMVSKYRYFARAESWHTIMPSLEMPHTRTADRHERQPRPSEQRSDSSGGTSGFGQGATKIATMGAHTKQRGETNTRAKSTKRSRDSPRTREQQLWCRVHGSRSGSRGGARNRKTENPVFSKRGRSFSVFFFLYDPAGCVRFECNDCQRQKDAAPGFKSSLQSRALNMKMTVPHPCHTCRPQPSPDPLRVERNAGARVYREGGPLRSGTPPRRRRPAVAAAD